MTGQIGKNAQLAVTLEPTTAASAAPVVLEPIASESEAISTLDSAPTYRTGQQLLARFEETGDEIAFEQIVRLYAGMVYTVCNGVTKNGHDAEDATQATFLALASQVKLGKSVKYLGPWLRQVAKRTALDLRKSRKRREKREQNHNQQTCGATFEEHAGEANLNAEEYKQLLHDEINRLPARYRLPLVMHYFGGLKPEETALELNCKPKTLAVRLHRGRKMLAQKLSRRGLFANCEMLGVSMMPVIGGAMNTNLLHQTSHAASSLLTGHDITTLISSRVMALVRGSAQAAFFAKLKFLSVLIVLICGTFAGGATAVRALGLPIHWQLPSLKFNVSDWIRPMLRSLVPTPKFVADASMTKTSANSTKRDRADIGTAMAVVSQSPTNSAIALASFDTPNFGSSGASIVTRRQLALIETSSASSIDLTEAPSYSIEFNLRSAVPAPTSAPSSFAFLSREDEPLNAGTLAALDASAPGARRMDANPTPAPEPANLLLVSAGAALLVVRRREVQKSAGGL